MLQAIRIQRPRRQRLESPANVGARIHCHRRQHVREVAGTVAVPGAPVGLGEEQQLNDDAHGEQGVQKTVADDLGIGQAQQADQQPWREHHEALGRAQQLSGEAREPGMGEVGARGSRTRVERGAAGKVPRRRPVTPQHQGRHRGCGGQERHRGPGKLPGAPLEPNLELLGPSCLLPLEVTTPSGSSSSSIVSVRRRFQTSSNQRRARAALVELIASAPFSGSDSLTGSSARVVLTGPRRRPSGT